MEAGREGARVFYEVHVLHEDRWLIDCTLERQETAIEQAAFIFQRPGVFGVKVRKEIYDPVRDFTASRLVFERSRTRPRSEVRPNFRSAAPVPLAPLEQPHVAPRRRVVPEQLPAAGFDWLSPGGLSIIGAAVAALAAASIALTG